MKRGLTQREAAEYVGVSKNTFLKLVNEGQMPKPIKIGSRTIFDRFDIDEAFDELHPSAETEIAKWRKG